MIKIALQRQKPLYTEQEMELGLSRFFGHRVYNVVRGYEEALRKSAQKAS